MYCPFGLCRFCGVFFMRWTREELNRADDIAAANYPVEEPATGSLLSTMRACRSWFDAAVLWIGEARRFSAKFNSPIGSHVIGSGHRDGDRPWFFVSGEFEAR